MSASKSLSLDEIQQFWDEIDLEKDGTISFESLEKKLQAVYDELVTDAKQHHLRRSSQTEKYDPASARTSDDLHDLLYSLMPDYEGRSITKDQFIRQVQGWNVPSQRQIARKNDRNHAREYEKKLSYTRRARAWWSVKGPEMLFVLFVFLLTLGMALWQFLKYVLSPVTTAAFGWGVCVAKLSSGALYPLFFFLILSMSRWFATFSRRSYILSSFINWDLSRSFHIRISCIALFFSCLHAFGHLTGTFVYGSQPGRQAAVAARTGTPMSQHTYVSYLQTRGGWSGFTALTAFLMIAITSTPRFRKKTYEGFQLVHLLMYVVFAMLAIHGTGWALQKPMMGYWIVFPVLLVLAERVNRLAKSFISHPARLEALDDGTVVIIVEKPEGQKWGARAGQYILLQVPTISSFQWHPFTISACIGNRLQVHIKADGNWTKKLHKMAMDNKNPESDDMLIRVGLDGPFGAPVQRFYSFDKSIIIGAGIGITPFAACLTDLEENFKAQGDPWKLTPTRSFYRRNRTLRQPTILTPVTSLTPVSSRVEVSSIDTLVDACGEGDHNSEKVRKQGLRKDKAGSFGVRRVDFHWSVREKNDLLWFSDLLNRASSLAENDASHLTLNIHAHITAKGKDVSTHVFRYLLDAYRTEEQPYSALTQLKAAAHFGRPDFEEVLSEYYEDMASQGWTGRVGIFFCGPPIVGKLLADQCAILTARATSEGNGMRFIFNNEVF